MEKHNLDIKDNVLDEKNYTYSNETNLLLKDKIVAYYNGLNWKIVPLDIFLSYPVIYDKYYNEDSNGKRVTIAVCPFTLVTSMFEGEYYPSEYLLNSSLILTNKQNYLLPIVSGFSNDPNGGINKVKRWEVSIKTLRNAISDYPDCQFLNLTESPIKKVINDDYYYNSNLLFKVTNMTKDKIHPKTLVYVIQYKSSKTLNDKYSIIVGKDANTLEPSGYNIKDSGLLKYIEKMEFKLREKSAFLLPILWFACGNLFPNAKIIKLN